jgi:phosphoesterase RecJ-like protein
MAFDLKSELEGAGRIGITGHIKPDGDCIGSCLACFCYIKKLFPEAVTEVFLEEPGHFFASIPERDKIITDFPDRPEFDVFIICDTNRERTGAAIKYIESAHKVLNIDHHISNMNGSGDVNHVIPGMSSCAEILYDLMDKALVDKEIAELIYLGIVHDTGVFRFSNTSPETMKKGGQLIAYGFDFPMLIDTTFYLKTFVQNRFQAQIMLDAKRYCDDLVIVGVADKALMNVFGATKDDTDGAVNGLRNTAGVECAVFIYEKEDGLFKGSLRASTDRINVAVVAESFGGGGHVRAAGCEYRGTKEDNRS